MRSRSSNSFACNKSPNGKDYPGEARNERKTSRRNSRLIPIRNKQVHNKKPGKHHNTRKRTGSANAHRPDDKLALIRKTTSNYRNFGTLMPNLQNNTRKRVNVRALSKENAGKGDRNMRFLPFNLI